MGDVATFFNAISRAQMPMMVTDHSKPDDPIVFANAAFCDLTGYGAHELLGRNCRILQGPQTDPDTISTFREAMRREEAICTEVLNYRKNGEPFWNSFYVSPVFDDDGRVRFHFAAHLDVTRRHQDDCSANREQRLDSLIGLAGGVAHEINNLLTVIRGNLEPLLSGEADARDLERLRRVKVAGDRAAELTQSVMSFARKQFHQPTAIELGRFLVGCWSELAGRLGAKHRFDFVPADADTFVLADEKFLLIALSHLVQNAREAMDAPGMDAPGEVRISVAPAANDSAAPDAIVTVSDNGCGMSNEVASHAMDPFFTTKPQGRGPGLGLSIVHGFMRQSGGWLELDSREGNGTTVRLRFPSYPNGRAEGGEPAHPPPLARQAS